MRQFVINSSHPHALWTISTFDGKYLFRLCMQTEVLNPVDPLQSGSVLYRGFKAGRPATKQVNWLGSRSTCFKVGRVLNRAVIHIRQLSRHAHHCGSIKAYAQTFPIEPKAQLLRPIVKLIGPAPRHDVHTTVPQTDSTVLPYVALQSEI